MAAVACHVPRPPGSGLSPYVYEVEPGAASQPLPGGYRRHEPEKTALYAVVRGHLETLLDQSREGSASGAGYPSFVEKEFRRYLDCGILANGFARLRCPQCGFERLVAFSCKGRVCPSCWARRTADTAAHLVDRVLPQAHYRQWVLTFPWELRFHLAMDGKLLSELRTAFLCTVFTWQRRRGRDFGLRGEAGAITFTQRFGGILNLNPHFHSILPDGLFVTGQDGTVTFERLPAPTDADVRRLTERLAQRLAGIASQYLEGRQDDRPEDEDASLQASAAEALRVPVGRRAHEDGHDGDDYKPLCAKVDGFSLHAARTVAPHDREGLERLCRYGLRAPFSLERLSLTPDGQVRLALLRPWPGPGGRTEILLEPVALLRRLAALVPAPYQNMVHYHGVFANRSKLRPLLPKPPARIRFEVPQSDSQTASRAATTTVDASPDRPRRLSWAHLLRRVLDVDALTCARCAAPMLVLAFLTDPPVIHRILEHLNLPSNPPPVAPAASQDDDAPPDWDDEPSTAARVTRTPPARLPSRAPP
jgi:hypothetical protein